MIKILFEKSFSQDLKKYKKNRKLCDLIIEKTKVFSQTPYNSSLGTHKLSGKMNGLHAFKIKPDLRVVFQWKDDDVAVFLHVGTHNEVYE